MLLLQSIALVASASLSCATPLASSTSSRENVGLDRRNKAGTARFLTNATKPFQVKSLPDFPLDLGEMYSGNMPIKAGDPSRQLFFVFQPTIGEPVDEITIWLNGGPGCSSLEGFFQENGRYVWQPGQQKPTVNPYSWVNQTNMLWVEQPVGTGFTIGKPTAVRQEETAAEFIEFLRNFQKTFGIKNFKIFVTGESYAGRYVPYIGSAMLDQKDPSLFNLKGALIYDGSIGQYNYVQQQVPMFSFVKQHQEIFNFSSDFMQMLETQHKKCGYADFEKKYLTFPPSGQQPTIGGSPVEDGCDLFGIVYGQALMSNPCFNVYNIVDLCPVPDDPISTEIFNSSQGKTNYFNRDDVKAALHAPLKTKWSICSKETPYQGGKGGPEGEGDLSDDAIVSVLPKIIEATNRVALVTGDLDMVLITSGKLLAIQNMTWGGTMGFQRVPSTPVTLPGRGNVGIQHFETGLLYGETIKAGHMGPQYEPEVSLRHLLWLQGKIRSL